MEALTVLVTILAIAAIWAVLGIIGFGLLFVAVAMTTPEDEVKNNELIKSLDENGIGTGIIAAALFGPLIFIGVIKIFLRMK
jgi:hypothetical protein